MASVSMNEASVVTSASRPSMTARDCVLEPPCDCLIDSVSPGCSFWYLAVKAAFMSRHSSRVGSYETFSSVISRANAAATSARPATNVAAAMRIDLRRFISVSSARRKPRRAPGSRAVARRCAARSCDEPRRSDDEQRPDGRLQETRDRPVERGFLAFLGQRSADDDQVVGTVAHLGADLALRIAGPLPRGGADPERCQRAGARRQEAVGLLDQGTARGKARDDREDRDLGAEVARQAACEPDASLAGLADAGADQAAAQLGPIGRNQEGC